MRNHLERAIVRKNGVSWCCVIGVVAGALGCGVDARDLGVAEQPNFPDLGDASPASPAPGPNAQDDGGSTGPSEGQDDDLPIQDPDPTQSLECGSGTHACGSQCVSDFEVATCGSSCEPCVAPAGGTATCDGERCGAACPTGQQPCAGACIDLAASCDGSCPEGSHDCAGTCQPNTSTASCGNSCEACPVPSEGVASCDGVTCDFTCREGFHRCGDACVSDSSVSSCGLSCDPCPVPAGGTATCDGTSCGGSCPQGMRLCAGNCIPNAQACAGSCPSGTHDCAGTCQPNDNVNSCGNRCTPCPAPGGNGSATCNAGTCGVTCNAGSRLCGNTCFSNNSPQACGAACIQCPVPAGGAATCNAGVCGTSCPAGTNLCGGACVANGPNACGSSCQVCPAPTGAGSATCSGGVCGISCNQGSHRCGNACVSNSSVNSCGSSCSPCPEPAEGTATCNGTSCGVTCDDGLVLRGSSCVRVPIQVSAGGSTSCALFSDGSVACWGSNFNGELGTRTSEFTSSTPVLIAGLPRARQISVGDGALCALIDADGSVRCWGGNARGQLGNGSSVPTSAVPVQVTGVTGATSVSQSGRHACAVLGDGSIRCWGENNNGQLGNGTSGANALTPVTVANLGGAARSVSAGMTGFRTCAALTNGSVRCWGLAGGDQGILGNGVVGAGGAIATQPVTATGINNALSVVVGQTHTCAVLQGGGLRCWGINGAGELGTGNTTTALAPAAVSGVGNASSVALGNSFTCAQLAAGTVSCWGGNFDGNLGNGTNGQFSLTPVTVTGLSGVRSLAVGFSHACALAGDDSVRCWGNNGNAGQLGTGDFEDTSVPTRVVGL